MKRRLISLSLEKRRNLWGYLFISPFLIGFSAFFLYPFIQSIVFSLSELIITSEGFRNEYVGLENYRHALFVHGSFPRVFANTMVRTLSDVPAILVFSFFVAILLNQRFRGRTLMRVIMFLPVILGAGVILSIERGDYFTEVLMTMGDEGRDLALDSAFVSYITQWNLPEQLIEYVLRAVEHSHEIIKASGIQILILLSALQSVPKSLYEAADVDGATPWEGFWLITLPMVSPLIVTVVVYTVIDSFTAVHNELVQLISSVAITGAGYGVSTAMAWIYFGAIAGVLAITVGLISRKVFYQK